MSGVYGYMQNRAAAGAKIEIQKLQLWNRAYGREAEDMFEDGSFGIGCAYEKLAGDAARSCPVLKREEKYAVIDALLYNREELEERCGITEQLSEEELLLTYVLRFGVEGLREVNGDFSGAVYDAKEHSLLLFRDHMGVRPLFYYADDAFVAFSTDLRGLLSVEQVDATVSEDWIYRTVAGYWRDGLTSTEFQHILCVEPGGARKFSFRDGKVHTEKTRYWKPGEKKVRYSSDKEYIDKLRELITDAVKRRLDAVPGPVGAELSGGLDSGVIDILIHRLGRECVYFSWSMDPEKLPYTEGDERLVIRDICEQEKIHCHYVQKEEDVSEGAGMRSSMSAVLPEQDVTEHAAYRFALPPYCNTLTITETSRYMAQNGVRAVFTGHGGDEGVSHRSNPYELFCHHEYYHFLKIMWARAYREKRRIRGTLKRCYQTVFHTGREFHKPFRGPFRSPELLNAAFAAKFSKRKMPALTFAYDPKHYILHGGSRNRLDNVALQGAYSGVRYLIPYLDYRVVDFAVSIPRHLYLNGNQNRYIFREAFRELMPESLYTLRTKEDASRKNVGEDPDWFEKFRKEKADVVRRLDRGYWEQYLDYNLIMEWLQRGKPSEEDRLQEENIHINLFYCAMIENLIEKTRGRNEEPERERVSDREVC